jgi:hypothetical protein
MPFVFCIGIKWENSITEYSCERARKVFFGTEETTPRPNASIVELRKSPSEALVKKESLFPFIGQPHGKRE